MITAAVVPIKELEDAKRRLADVLTPEERRELVRAMVEDVLRALVASRQFDRVMVITRAAEISEMARSLGVGIIPEPDKPGLISAVREAAKYLAREGVDLMVFVPADIPLIGVDEIDVVLSGVGTRDEPEFVIVPARDMGGSNCVVCSPPDCMEFGFGEDSFRRHLRIARQLGIEPVVARLPGIGLDVDTPDDLYELARKLDDKAVETRTHKFLVDSGIMARLSEGFLRIG